MKDNFSKQAGLYAKFRPGYPEALIRRVVDLVPEKKLAWDCATGNGQVAKMLAPHFRQVVGTDISKKQLDHATALPNVTFQIGKAEKTDFADSSLDLITVGQAIHWFDHGGFHREVSRIAKPGGILAVFGYPLLTTAEPLNGAIAHFYHQIVGPFWDAERRHIDERWARIPFPFEKIEMPHFEQRYVWTFPQLLGYLKTWSACQHYLREKGEHPVELFQNELKKAWGNTDTCEVVFEIFTRVGKVVD